MSTVVRYVFRYDGARYFGARAVLQLKALAANFGLKFDPKLPMWKNLVQIFKLLPDYNKALVVVREPRKTRQSRYKAMWRKGDLL